MHDLADFQDSFVRALHEPAIAAEPFTDRPMDVYRNTVAKGLIDVLRAAYPTVERLVGEEWFAAAALAFARRSPPDSAVLADYGGAFAPFLEAFPPAAELPYLPEVAAIDRLWSEAHFAADEAVLEPAELAALDPETLMAGRLRLHASARFDWFSTPAATIWRANRPPAEALEAEGLDIAWRPEGIALARPGGVVLSAPLGPGAHALLKACRQGWSFGDALVAALSAQPDLALEACVSDLITTGLFAGFDRAPFEQETYA